MPDSHTAGDDFIVHYIYPIFGVKNDLALFDQMVWISFLYTLVVACSMGLFPAPYGRYSSNKFGFMLPGKLAWILQESPAFIVPIILLFTTSSTCWQSPVNKILVICFGLHYIQRSIIFPLTTRGSKPSPFGPFISAVIFCIFNGFMQCHFLLNYNCYGKEWLTYPNFMLGMTLFVVGMFINIHSDQLLIRLRKPGETGYKIPTGGLFDYVTGANFFGEIVEWFGFALATWSSTAAVFALFSASFLGLRAWHHHKFYLSKFEDYPRSRKVIIPYIL